MLKVISELEQHYDIHVEDSNIILDKKEDISIDKNRVLTLIQELKKHKKCALDIIENPIKKYKNTVAVDIETSTLRPRDGEIKLISVYGDNIEIVTEDIDDVASILSDEDILKVFHNALFDVTWLINKGYKVNNFIDTMIISQVINNHSKGGNKLKELAKKYLDINLDKGLQDSENWENEITQDHRDYCLQDSKVTLELYYILQDKIEELHLEAVLRREIEVLPAVVELQENGIIFDYEGWQNELENMEKESEDILIEVRERLNNPQLNLMSPAQIIESLRNNGIEIEGTSDEILRKYEDKDEVVRYIRKYKKLKKQVNSFGEKIRKLLGEDSRLRGNWRLIGTDTSRMTCNEPNLQGMPGMSKKYFHPSKGHSFIVADYSNIELRILAEISKDEEMVKAFLIGEDLHTKTAKVVLGKGLNEVISPSERKIGKVINFGLVYGMTKYGLQKKINGKGENNITLEEAEDFKNRYFNIYQGVLQYQDKMLRSSFIETLGGRYWSIENRELPKGKIARFNYPIQASGAEGLKDALILFLKHKKKEWKLAAIVHDEIVVEVPDKDVLEATIKLKEVMIEGMKKILKMVPVEVEIKSAKYWIKD